MLCEYRLINSGSRYAVTGCTIDSYRLFDNGVMLKNGNTTDIIPWHNLAYIRFKEMPDDDMKIWEKGETYESETTKSSNQSDSGQFAGL